MTTFNRFLLILLALGGALFWAGAIFTVWVFPRELSEILRAFSATLRLQPTLLQGMVTAFGVSAMAVSLLVLVGELFPQEPTMVAVDNVHGGTAAITIAALLQGLKQELEQRTGVQAVRPTITPRRNGIDVHVELHAGPETQLVHKAEDVSRIVHDQIEEKWGLKLRNVQVTFTQPIHADGQAQHSTGNDPSKATGDIIVPSLRNEQQASSEAAQGQAREREEEERGRL